MIDVKGTQGLFTFAFVPLVCHLESPLHRMVEAPWACLCQEQETSHPSAKEKPLSPLLTHGSEWPFTKHFSTGSSFEVLRSL